MGDMFSGGWPELEVWLQNQPPEVGRAISVRAVLRVLPIIALAMREWVPKHLRYFGEVTAAAFRAARQWSERLGGRIGGAA